MCHVRLLRSLPTAEYLRPLIYIGVLVIFMFISGCDRNKKDELFISVAISLSDLFEEIIDDYESNNNINIISNYAASQSLASQIIYGNRSDLFIPAGIQPVEILIKNGKLPITYSPEGFITNSLVFASVNTNEFNWDTESISKITRIAIADPDLSPSGKYAMESLRNLLNGERMAFDLIYASNVRAALGLLTTGSVNAAIVYATDVKNQNEIVAHDIIPPDAHSAIIYPVVVLKDNSNFIQEFVEYLYSEHVEKLILKHGFISMNDRH